jgi:hypothetical protein
MSPTKFDYDAAGQLTSTELAGNKTVTQYDALGHAISVTEEARRVLKADWVTQLSNSGTVDLGNTALTASTSPYTAMSYDAFGNRGQGLTVPRWASLRSAHRCLLRTTRSPLPSTTGRAGRCAPPNLPEK